MPNLAVMTNSALMVLHIRSDSGERIWDRIIFFRSAGRASHAPALCAPARAQSASRVWLQLSEISITIFPSWNPEVDGHECSLEIEQA